MNPLKYMLNPVVYRIPFHLPEHEMDRADLHYDYNFFEIGYYGHPAFPYAHIQIYRTTKLILSHIWEEYNPFIYDTLNNKKYTIGLLVLCL